MMNKLAIALLCLLPAFARAQSIETKAGELMQAYSDQQKFSGNVLIASKGKIVFNQSYGFADRQQKRLNNSNTTFRAASLTKMFTAVLIMQLAEKKMLRLEDRVNKYLPGVDPTNKVALKHLLSHSSGLKGTTPQNAASVEDLVLGYEASPAAFAAGEKFEYNNFNFILLGYIAEKITGKDFATLLSKNILKPLGMKRTGLDSYERQDQNKALGYVTDPATNEWTLAGNDAGVALAFAAGGVYTTVGDLYTWSKAIGSPALLTKKSWDQVLTIGKGEYGLGMIIQNMNGRQKLGHTGAIPGYLADLAIFPKDSITIIYLSNYQDTDGRKLEETVAALAHNEPYQVPVAKKAIVLRPDELQAYVGDYELAPQVEIKVLVENNKLMAIAPGGDKVELTAEAVDKFFLKGPEIGIEFRRTGGKIASLFVDMQGGQLFRRKG